MMKLSNLILTASLGLAAMPGAWAAIILADNTSEHFDSDNGRTFSDKNRWAAASESPAPWSAR